MLVSIAAVITAFAALAQIAVYQMCGAVSPLLLALSLAAGTGVALCCLSYLSGRNKALDDAADAVRAYLDGDSARRILCDGEGAQERLFHALNTLAGVLSAHAQNGLRAKEMLKNAISDISHQIKTPLAALNVYNGLLQEEEQDASAAKELAGLSERELDRIESLVQSLLKITRLDAGAVAIEKTPVNVAEMFRDIELSFAYRAKREGKEILLIGDEKTTLCCDHDWMIEAVGNLVKNALDHSEAGDHIWMEWKRTADLLQLVVRDDGTGIRPEDIHHIFKRFYRSGASQGAQGIGLGLPLAKAIVEAHGGHIAVDSEWGRGSAFTLSFLIPTKL